jgi:NTP pyrophosphatase (non-canonical NTP hydrolase)
VETRSLTPKLYQSLCSRTECDQTKSAARYSVEAVRLNHSVIGLCGEVGELAGLIEKWLHYGQPFDANKFKDEFGDCLWYIAEGLNALGLDMGEVMEANIRKLRARYPEKYSDLLAAEENRKREQEMLAVVSKVDLSICPRCRDRGGVGDEWSSSLSPCPVCGKDG